MNQVQQILVGLEDQLEDQDQQIHKILIEVKQIESQMEIFRYNQETREPTAVKTINFLQDQLM